MSTRQERAVVDAAGQDEAMVLQRVRRGDRSAYGVLYERHVASTRRIARAILRTSADVDDAVAEGFASAFSAIRRGRGPTDAFGPYIKSCVRHECFRLLRRSGCSPFAATDQIDGAPDESDEYSRKDEQDVVQRAFDGLSERMRSVLWLSEVEGRSHAEIAESIGSSPNAVAALAMRARRELSAKYLQAHLVTTAKPSGECGDVRRRLAEIVRGEASRRVSTKTAAHLATCPDCAAAQTQLVAVNSRLRSTPIAALLAGVGAPTLLRLSWKARLAALVSVPGVKLTAATSIVVLSALGPDPSLVLPPAPPERVRAVEEETGAVDEPPVVAGTAARASVEPARTARTVTAAPTIAGPRMVGDFESLDPEPPPGLAQGPVASVDTTVPVTSPTTTIAAVTTVAAVLELPPPVVEVPPVAIPPLAVAVDLDVELDTPSVDDVVRIDVDLPVPPISVAVSAPRASVPVATIPRVVVDAGVAVGAGPSGVAAAAEMLVQDVAVEAAVDDGIDASVDVATVCVPLLNGSC